MTITLDGIEEALAGLSAALDEEMPGAFVEVAGLVADEAQRQHPYQNRTGRLESMTMSGAVSGTFSKGTLSVEVLGATSYGAYVDEGTHDKDGNPRNKPYPFLGPAYARAEGRVIEAVEAGMTRAAERAGWKP